MRACPCECKQQFTTFYLVDQKPIRLNVTLTIASIISNQGMIVIPRRKRFFMDEAFKDLPKKFGAAAALHCLGIIFLETLLIVDVKEALINSATPS